MEAQINPLLSLPAIEELEVVRFLDAAGHVSDDVVPFPNERIFQAL